MEKLFKFENSKITLENSKDSTLKDSVHLDIDETHANSTSKDNSYLNKFSAENPQLCAHINLSENNSSNKTNDNMNKIANSTIEKIVHIIDNKNKVIKISTIFSEKANNFEKNYSIEDSIDISEYDSKINLVMKFEFKLDEFQKRSIIRLEQQKNILVCAPTSSGKTLVAEYAIALANKNETKVIYVSPIKALSNQKYNEFKNKFKSVGIITGDVEKNRNAECLIVTAEILHKFLYSKNQILNNVSTIIFDEIHYINDLDRGHIWEEILIILPNSIKLVMLSATIPNYLEFANWVGKLKKGIIYIEIAKTRPVPMEYYLYVNSQNIMLVKDRNDEVNKSVLKKTYELMKKLNSSNINTNNNKALKYKNNININKNEINLNKNKDVTQPKEGQSEKPTEEDNNIINNKPEIKEDNIIKEENNNIEENNEFYEKLQKKNKIILENVKYILDKELYPATIFIFNIKKINTYAEELIKDLGEVKFNITKKYEINKFFEEKIKLIPSGLQQLNQIKNIKMLLQNGIGIHHSGLLPILKEIIELLYAKGLINILISTTSFSIGLNMPTRTVVFVNIYKYSDNKSQILTSSEFIQMSGRAGRRGLDPSGNVYIICCETLGKEETNKIYKLLEGKGTKLESRFRLSYRILLSLINIKSKSIMDFINESFIQYNYREMKYDKNKEINKLKNEINKKCEISCDKLENSNECSTDIEDFPIFKLINTNKEIENFNNKLFVNEKLITYINKNLPIILKVKDNKNKSVNVFHNPLIVIALNNFKCDEGYKLWCFTITSYDKNKNTQNCENKEEIHSNYIIGEYEQFNYKYCLINYTDIIQAYEFPNLNKVKLYFDDDKKTENFNRTNDENLYFKNNSKFFKPILKDFIRIILNYFKEYHAYILKENKNKRNFRNEETRELNYKEIIEDNTLDTELDKLKKLKEISKNNKCSRCRLYEQDISKAKIYMEINNNIKNFNNSLLEGSIEQIKSRINSRLNLLLELEYIKQENTININEKENNFENFTLTSKGISSLEINTNDSVFITELLIKDIFTNEDNILPNEVIIPFLSIFVENIKTCEMNYSTILKEKLLNSEIKLMFDKFCDIYNELLKCESLNNINESNYNRNFSFEYFIPVEALISGKSFCDVCKECNIEEGKLYYIINRIRDLSGEIYNFYNKLGNEKLAKKFTEIKEILLKMSMKTESLYIKDKL